MNITLRKLNITKVFAISFNNTKGSAIRFGSYEKEAIVPGTLYKFTTPNGGGNNHWSIKVN